MNTKKHYYAAPHDAALIASEVLQSGKSSGWSALNEEDLKVAKEIEGILSTYNIGYTDDMSGEWRHKQGGSKFFTVRAAAKNAQHQFNKLKNIFRK